VFGWKAKAFDGDGFVDAIGVDTCVVQDNPTAEGMSDKADGKFTDDIEQCGEVENVLGDGVGGARRPSAIAVAAQIERVDVLVAA
jgi:hypothetical protein